MIKPEHKTIIYKGASRGIEIEIVPITEGLVECPVCGGGVREVGCTFTDASQGYIQGVTLVYSKHKPGGKRGSKDTLVCSGSGQPTFNFRL